MLETFRSQSLYMGMRYLGTDDTVHVCDCCGKKGLKSVIGLETEYGEVVRYGVTCAAKALKSTVKAVKAGTKAADDAKYLEEQAKRAKAQAEFSAKWTAHLDSRCPSFAGDRFRQIEALGGYAKAQEGFIE